MKVVIPWIDSDMVPGAHMLAGEAYRHRWKLPKIKSFAPAGNDAASKTLSQYDIGVEWQVGAMLLDRADRQTKYRSLAEKL
jgi:hypothetical protein